MRWPFSRKRTVQVVAPEEIGELITVPFRFVEALRVSIHTIGSQKELPEDIRMWIAQWLENYNSHLVTYMKESYGPGVFPILDQITTDVMPRDEWAEYWDHLERQFGEDS